MTADEIVAVLRQEYRDTREWVCFQELRLGTGYGGAIEQRIDFWALNCYPSAGMQSLAYEIKVTRSDFKRELADPKKRQAAMEVSNRFYFAAPAGLIPLDEIPAGCGLVEIADGKATTVLQATWRDRLASPPWRFLASVCRRVRDDKDQ